MENALRLGAGEEAVRIDSWGSIRAKKSGRLVFRHQCCEKRLRWARKRRKREISATCTRDPWGNHDDRGVQIMMGGV